LGGPVLGVEDNFFEHGGHSLMAMRLLARVQKIFHVTVGVHEFFDHPTVAALASRLDTGGADAAPTPARPVLGQLPRPAQLPLSFGQARLWFLDRFHGGSAHYNLLAALPIQGPLDHAALTRAVTALVARHEALRTRFAEYADEPVQIVDPPAPVDLPVEDLQTLAPEAQRQRLRAELQQARSWPFDLTRGPLLRLKVLTLRPDEHLLLRTVHHIVCDGWSEGIFHRELQVLYDAFRHDQPSPLPPLPVQYPDFALWQRATLSEPVLDHLLTYWRAHLDGAPATLDLPTARPRPRLQSFAGDRHHFVLSPETVQALHRLNAEHATTLYMTMLAAFGALLSRYADVDDLVVGSPVANRPDSDLDKLIGFFTETLPVRIRVPHGSSFRSLLNQVRETALGAYAHQQIPFSALVEALAPARRSDVMPIVQVTFALQNLPSDPPIKSADVPPDWRPNPVADRDVPGRFELEVYGWERAGGIGLTWIYNRALFDRPWVEQLARDYVRLLTAVAADSTQPVAAVALESAAPAPVVVAPPDRTLLDRIEAQVAARP